MTYLLFATALSLSAVAEYYSIMGLMAIFSGSPISIAVMGVVLGVAKLVITSWLYRNWSTTVIAVRSYFVAAIAILMLLTSMGIFGYLSKAHLEQGVVSGGASAEVALLDEKIVIEKENINAARKTLAQLDAQVDAALNRTTDSAGADKSSTIRRNQSKERSRLLEEIGTSQKEISKLQEERAPRAAELRKVEAEVGPIKYIAAIIYDEAASEETLEKAVRWVILLIVAVFDPLAVLMFVAYNQSVSQKVQTSQDVSHEIQIKETVIEDAVPNNDLEFDAGVRVDDQITIEKW